MLEKKKKKKKNLCVQVMLLFWVCKTDTPILNGIVFLVTGKFFSRNQMKTRQKNVNFYLGLANLRCFFLRNYWCMNITHTKKMCKRSSLMALRAWTLFIARDVFRLGVKRLRLVQTENLKVMYFSKIVNILNCIWLLWFYLARSYTLVILKQITNIQKMFFSCVSNVALVVVYFTNVRCWLSYSFSTILKHHIKTLMFLLILFIFL